VYHLLCMCHVNTTSQPVLGISVSVTLFLATPLNNTESLDQTILILKEYTSATSQLKNDQEQIYFQSIKSFLSSAINLRTLCAVVIALSASNSALKTERRQEFNNLVLKFNKQIQTTCCLQCQGIRGSHCCTGKR
jgi:hypothetical protein